MFTKLKNVFVDKISLVTKSETPAVPKATTKFALFKTKKETRQDRLEVVEQKLKKSVFLSKVAERLQK